ncbi:MAG TPA: SHOCT domain-containing protein [Ktedonobacteraceae bacterium]
MRHRFEHPWAYGYGHPWGHGYGHPWGHEYVLWPGTLLSALSTLILVALFIWLAWLLLRWIIPYLMPMFAGNIAMEQENPSALEILRRRYAAGEIDAVTFEQMREQLEASSPRGYYGIHPDDDSYPRETRSGYRDTFSSPISLEQRDARMAKRKRYPSEPKD